ncbi:MAG: M48 family metallopeptidase [bacterium]|nr:M48 family metallopeptidase [bacterium]
MRKTFALFALFLVVVIGVGWVFSRAFGNPSILYIAVLFSVLMNVAAYWYSDKLVLSMTHARPVTRESHRELYNIVENLCITAGLPVPKIYIVPEKQPNAFATGRNPKHAALAVTEGLLEILDRSELEGVISHELSHIGNRDMLVSTAAVVLVGFITILSDFFMRSLWFRGRSDDRGGAGSVMFPIAIAFSILAPISAMLLQLAISRKREFLADASGALLTRYPEGLALALEKISSSPVRMRFAGNTTAHLWIDDPFDDPTGRKYEKKTPLLHKLFMTHPPVGERVRALRGLEI